jgi:hypothetical protein
LVGAAFHISCSKPTLPEQLILADIQADAKGSSRSRIGLRLVSENADNVFKVVELGAAYAYGESLSIDPDGGTLTPSGAARMNGAEHVYLCERPCITFKEYVVESDPAFPLSFTFRQGKGYVYLAGRGSVHSGDGRSWRVGYSTTEDQWVFGLQTGDDSIREGSAQALGWIGTDESVTPLLAALTDGRDEVRRNVAEALGRVVTRTASRRKQEVIDALSKAAQSGESTQKQDPPWSARAAAEAIETIKTGRLPMAVEVGYEVLSSDRGSSESATLRARPTQPPSPAGRE